MRRALLWIAAVAFGCGGSSEMTRQLSVAGTYATQVALLPAGNTCSVVSVQDNPTAVAHTPGAETLSLTHAGTTYSGSITQTGAFSVPATAVSGGFTVSIAGQFTAMGLTAIAHVVQGPPPPCGYDVSWTGTKSGNTNTFP